MVDIDMVDNDCKSKSKSYKSYNDLQCGALVYDS